MDASSSSRPDAPAAKKRKVSDKKADDTCTSLGDDQKKVDVQEKVTEIKEGMENDPELIDIVRGLMAKRKKKQEVARVPPGIRELHHIRNALAQKMLVRMTKVDSAIFVNLDGEDNCCLMIKGLGGNKKYKLPAKNMSVEDLLEWGEKTYIACGECFEGVQWDAPYFDLDWRLGFYRFFDVNGEPEELDLDLIIKQIKRLCDGQIADLPVGFQPKMSDVGVVWGLTENYNKDAILKNYRTGATMPIAPLFDIAAEPGKTSARKGRNTRVRAMPVFTPVPAKPAAPNRPLPTFAALEDEGKDEPQQLVLADEGKDEPQQLVLAAGSQHEHEKPVLVDLEASEPVDSKAKDLENLDKVCSEGDKVCSEGTLVAGGGKNLAEALQAARLKRKFPEGNWKPSCAGIKLPPPTVLH